MGYRCQMAVPSARKIIGNIETNKEKTIGAIKLLQTKVIGTMLTSAERNRCWALTTILFGFIQ